MKQTILNMIREYMNEHDLTPYRIVKDSNLSRTHTYNILNGTKDTNIDTLLEMANAIGLNLVLTVEKQ